MQAEEKNIRHFLQQLHAQQVALSAQLSNSEMANAAFQSLHKKQRDAMIELNSKASKLGLNKRLHLKQASIKMYIALINFFLHRNI